LPRQDLCFRPTASPVTTGISSGPFSFALTTPTVSEFGADPCAMPVARLPARRFLPLLASSLPLRTINPSGSWPFGPASLARYVRARLEHLQECLPQEHPDLSSLPGFRLLKASNRITVPSPLTFRFGSLFRLPLGTFFTMLSIAFQVNKEATSQDTLPHYSSHCYQ
jgi:hypothetical protein